MPFQVVLQLFAQEEFLRKLSLSKYNDKFVLKGGMFIYTLTNYESRPTRDVDLLLRNISGEISVIENITQEICTIKTGNDFINIEFIKIKQIGQDKNYPGARISLLGKIGKVKIPFSIDIGIDDVVVPPPTKRAINVRLPEFMQPEVYVYSLESTVAEKFDAILQRMSTTSRMKDFFDIYYLSNTFDFDGNILCKAIKETTTHRRRNISNSAIDDIRDFVNDDYMILQWSNYEPAKKALLSFDNTINSICSFLEPIYEAMLEEDDFTYKWNCNQQQWLHYNIDR